MEKKKYKHLTLEEKEEIQECLNRRINIKEICKRKGKDQTTISKKVKKRI